jgi:uncharacterized protein YdcH (DUF465 family)
MMEDLESIRDILDREDPEFHQLATEHQQYEARLQLLTHKISISPEEELEEKTLKKRKLYLKDRMFEKMRGYASAQSRSA